MKETTKQRFAKVNESLFIISALLRERKHNVRLFARTTYKGYIIFKQTNNDPYETISYCKNIGELESFVSGMLNATTFHI